MKALPMPIRYLVLSMLLGHCSFSFGENIVFPPSDYVQNIKTKFNARGDGVADDTEALQNAVVNSSGILYLPNGIYLVTGSILGSGEPGGGPWIYGQSRDSVIIRLDDNAPGFDNPDAPRPVIASHNKVAGDALSADFFYRQWHNFTVDAGNNAGAIGIRYYSNNSGTLNNVCIKGNGIYGLDLGWVDMNGPCLIRDVLVEGFDIGVYTAHGLNSQTLYNVTVRNCRSFGIYHSGQNFSVENLTVTQTPTAIHADGMFCIINGTFTGSDNSKPAIINKSILYARNIRSSGFSMVLQDEKGDMSGTDIEEYSSDETITSFEDTPKKSLALPIKQVPAVNWESDVLKWVCVNDYGAVAGDNQDDSKSIQAAIDAAAAAGKTTVYLNPGIGGDPNWYTLDSDVYIHGSVRHIIGLGFARIIGRHGFVLDNNTAPLVRFENLVSLAPEWCWKITNSAASTAVIDNSDGMVIDAMGSGDIFINNVCGIVNIKNTASNVWARQWDNEANRSSQEEYIIDSDNDGGTLWILGYKTEQLGTKILTRNGGYTEVLGAHVYNCNPSSPKEYPLFEIIDASASFAVVREVNFNGSDAQYQFHVKETRDGVTKTWRSSSNTWSLYRGGSYEPTRTGFKTMAVPSGLIRNQNRCFFDISGRLLTKPGNTAGNRFPFSNGLYLEQNGNIKRIVRAE